MAAMGEPVQDGTSRFGGAKWMKISNYHGLWYIDVYIIHDDDDDDDDIYIYMYSV